MKVKEIDFHVPYGPPYISEFRVPLFQSESKCETISYDFDLHENETASRAHFHIMKGFALSLDSF